MDVSLQVLDVPKTLILNIRDLIYLAISVHRTINSSMQSTSTFEIMQHYLSVVVLGEKLRRSRDAN